MIRFSIVVNLCLASFSYAALATEPAAVHPRCLLDLVEPPGDYYETEKPREKLSRKECEHLSSQFIVENENGRQVIELPISGTKTGKFYSKRVMWSKSSQIDLYETYLHTGGSSSFGTLIAVQRTSADSSKDVITTAWRVYGGHKCGFGLGGVSPGNDGVAYMRLAITPTLLFHLPKTYVAHGIEAPDVKQRAPWFKLNVGSHEGPNSPISCLGVAVYQFNLGSGLGTLDRVEIRDGERMFFLDQFHPRLVCIFNALGVSFDGETTLTAEEFADGSSRALEICPPSQE